MPTITITPNAIYAIMLGLLLCALLHWLDKHGQMGTAEPVHITTPPPLGRDEIDFTRTQVDDVVTCDVVVKIGDGAPVSVYKDVQNALTQLGYKDARPILVPIGQGLFKAAMDGQSLFKVKLNDEYFGVWDEDKRIFLN